MVRLVRMRVSWCMRLCVGARACVRKFGETKAAAWRPTKSFAGQHSLTQSTVPMIYLRCVGDFEGVAVPYAAADQRIADGNQQQRQRVAGHDNNAEEVTTHQVFAWP